MPTELMGTIHGRLKVISRHSVDKHRHVYWNVRCLSCNNVKTMAARSLKNNVHGCTECSRKKKTWTPREDHIGKIYGGIKVLGILDGTDNDRYRFSVECLHCQKHYSLRSDKALRNTNGCLDCLRSLAPVGVDSQYWVGGKYISQAFLARFRRGAKSRNISFEITLDELDEIWERQEGKCVYSGVSLIIGNRRTEQTASLDRINSDLGYLKSNVHFVHKDINIMKWDFTEERFLEIITLISKNMNLGD